MWVKPRQPCATAWPPQGIVGARSVAAGAAKQWHTKHTKGEETGNYKLQIVSNPFRMGTVKNPNIRDRAFPKPEFGNQGKKSPPA